MKLSVLEAAATALLVIGSMTCVAGAQTVVTWDGGDDDFAAAKWNGGMTAEMVFGDTRISNGSYDISIGGGSEVTYTAPGTGGGLRPRFDGGPTRVTIKEGASLTHTTAQAGDADGMWTQWDADLILDNGTFRRDFEPGGNAEAGGIIMFGSWSSVQNQEINVVLKNGGSFENDGQVWFGADQEHAVGLKVDVEINGGTMDLTGGDLHQVSNDGYPTGWGDTFANLAFFYGRQLAEGNGSAMDGTPKGEKYRINFTGPGSIIVDTIDSPAPTMYGDGKAESVHGSGIRVYMQDEFTVMQEMKASYEDLWNMGILTSHGISGASTDAEGNLDAGPFANFFTVTGDPNSDDYTVAHVVGPTVTWDGGNGVWTDAKWNGGQDAQTAMGRSDGTENGHQIVIGGGSEVLYNSGNPGVNSDFRNESKANGQTSVTIKEGASLELYSQDTDSDGKWTRWNGDLTLDNGTLKRTFGEGTTGSTVSGGALIFGTWNTVSGQEIDVNLSNGGRIENDGAIWFGAGNDQANELTVTMTINNGSLDLTGGDNWDMINIDNNPGDGVGEGDLVFFFGRDTLTGDLKGENYAINFTGSGSITVDHAGIFVYTVDEFFVLDFEAKTYEDLWNDGILQADGLSGLDGATFGDYFSVTGTLGSDDYVLTSLLAPPGLAGDYNNDGKVDAADYTMWRDNFGAPAGTLPNDVDGGVIGMAQYDTWVANFGTGTGAGAGGNAAVPEPSTLVLALGLVLAGLAGRRLRG